ncbi:partial Methyl-accepting chemotaxis protein McpB, partial [Anaerolineae bacterium]
MMGIRTKIIAFTSTLTIVIATLSCILFLLHTKRQQEKALKKFGESLVILLAQDNEVKYALSYTQQAFLDTPLKMIQSLDREKEIGYWRISNIQSVLVAGNAPWLSIDMEEIPAKKGSENHEILMTTCNLPSLEDVFYDFSIPVFEKQTFSEESFAAQVLDEVKINVEQKTLGFVQIGISSHKLKRRINGIVLRSLFPIGLIIILGGTCITIFLTRYLVLPLQQMANMTLDISKGDLSQTVEARSRDEIGQLSVNFNKMTRSLKTSYDDLRKEISERKRAEELLEYRVKMEKLIAAISTNFINLAPDEVDIGINRSLKLMGEFGNVDRTYVFLYLDGNERMDNTHEWCAEGIDPQIENLKGV